MGVVFASVIIRISLFKFKRKYNCFSNSFLEFTLSERIFMAVITRLVGMSLVTCYSDLPVFIPVGLL